MSEQITPTSTMNAYFITYRLNKAYSLGQGDSACAGYPTNEEVSYCINFYDNLLYNLEEAGPDFRSTIAHVINLRQMYQSMKYFREMP